MVQHCLRNISPQKGVAGNEYLQCHVNTKKLTAWMKEARLDDQVHEWNLLSVTQPAIIDGRRSALAYDQPPKKGK